MTNFKGPVARPPPLLLVPSLTLAVILAFFSQSCQQVALGATLDAARIPQVQPFDEHAHLPDGARRPQKTFVAPTLGNIMRLNMHAQTEPMSSLAMKTMFHIYTSAKVTPRVTFQAALAGDIKFDLSEVAASGFDASKRTVVMIPGYLSEEEADWARAAGDTLLEIFGSDINVIIVGWFDSNRPPLEKAVANTVLVARQVVMFLHYLAQLSGTSLRDQDFLDRLHLVGHSCGAHIVGYVGKDLGGRVGRVTGLDPAAPIFDSLPRDQRLARSDAQLVDVLHTNAGRMAYSNSQLGIITDTIPSLMQEAMQGHGLGLWKGTLNQLGHIDYFANDGHTQEGCPEDPSHVCDHARAVDLFVDSLRYELQARKNGLSDARRNRLWAFRARDYADFQSGYRLEGLCPELVEPATHLNPAQVSQSFSQCAVPLIDMVTPARELIRELRDEHRVNFNDKAKAEDQPQYYFATHRNPREPSKYVGDHYFMKIYLDRAATMWDPADCLLEAQVLMHDGTNRTLALSMLDYDQTIIAAPFSHPAGAEAHAQLQELLATAQVGADRAAVEALARGLFPSEISMQYGIETLVVPRRISPVAHCTLAIQQVEVAPVSVYTPNNIGALYEDARKSSGAQLKSVNTRQLSDQLERPLSEKPALASRYTYKLDALLMNA